LYVKKDVIESLEPPFLDLHAADWTGPQEFAIRKDARRFENWESYVAGKLGLGAAVDYAMSIGLANIQSRVTDLAATLRARLSTIPHVTVKDKGANKCGIVTFVKDNLSVDAIKMQLRAQKINVSASRMESARLDMQERNETAFVRASVHYYNTEAEIERFCEAVAVL
jgi:selenocysteine lyase/cysteine desulfurase